MVNNAIFVCMFLLSYISWELILLVWFVVLFVLCIVYAFVWVKLLSVTQGVLFKKLCIFELLLKGNLIKWIRIKTDIIYMYIFELLLKGNLIKWIRIKTDIYIYIYRERELHWKEVSSGCHLKAWLFLSVTFAATAIFSYWWVVPFVFFGLLWWRGNPARYTFLELICVYGYSLAIYIPISVSWKTTSLENMFKPKQCDCIFVLYFTISLRFKVQVSDDGSWAWSFMLFYNMFVSVIHPTIIL